jgi:hypothetical protein
MESGLEPETIGDVITSLRAAALEVRHTGRSTRIGGADAARRTGAPAVGAGSASRNRPSLRVLGDCFG